MALTQGIFETSSANFINSSRLSPAILTTVGIFSFSRKEIFSNIKSLSPSLSSPMEFKSPPGVSTTRGGGFPSFLFRVIVFVIMAPSLFISTKSFISFPNPAVPEAKITGFFSSSFLILTFRFAI